MANIGKGPAIPPPKAKLKACGAEQDQEDCPTSKPLPWSKANECVGSVTENYIKFLYDPEYQVAKTIRGSNIPIEHDNKINWIRECMILEKNRMKINCLRKLREQVAMNPFYQYRIDRFIDAITQTYEPTDKEGFIQDPDYRE